MTITKGTGISTIYYKVNGATSWSSSTGNVSVSVNDLSTYYYYAVSATGYTANSDCGTASSPESGTVDCANVSKSVTATINTYAVKISAGTNSYISACSSNLTISTDKSYASGTVAYNSTVSATATANTNYAFDSSGTATKSYSATLGAAALTTTIEAPGYGKYTVSCTNCTSNVSTGWYTITTSKTTTFTANTNWSFGGSTLKDTKQASAAVPGSVSGSPGYCNITVSGTNCSANKSSGIIANGTVITWTASSGYAFNNSGTTTSTATVSGPNTYSKTPGYGYLTVSGSHRTVTENNAGWYTAGSSVTTTFKADEGWSFGGTTGRDTTTDSTTVPGTNSATPAYFYLTISNGTGCTVNKSSGWYNAAQTITWTRTSGYAFDSSGKTTTSQTTSAAPGSYTAAATHGYYTLTLTNCAYSSGNNAG